MHDTELLNSNAAVMTQNYCKNCVAFCNNAVNVIAEILHNAAVMTQKYCTVMTQNFCKNRIGLIATVLLF